MNICNGVETHSVKSDLSDNLHRLELMIDYILSHSLYLTTTYS